MTAEQREKRQFNPNALATCEVACMTTRSAQDYTHFFANVFSSRREYSTRSGIDL